MVNRDSPLLDSYTYIYNPQYIKGMIPNHQGNMAQKTLINTQPSLPTHPVSELPVVGKVRSNVLRLAALSQRASAVEK